ncbi:MAG: hypothetical protein AAB576_09210, partial [Elusimicrobiota bacterium]
MTPPPRGSRRKFICLPPKYQTALLEWYSNNRRRMPWREKSSGYRTWVSEIMLQQTQVATVIPYFERFMKRYPDLPALAKAR